MTEHDPLHAELVRTIVDAAWNVTEDRPQAVTVLVDAVWPLLVSKRDQVEVARRELQVGPSREALEALAAGWEGEAREAREHDRIGAGKARAGGLRQAADQLRALLDCEQMGADDV